MSVFNKNTRWVLSYDVYAAENGVMTKGVVSGGRGFDLRLRCTSSPSQTLRHHLVRTTNDGCRSECSARRRPSWLYFSHFVTRTVYNTIDLYALYAAIFVQNRVFCLPHLHLTPPLGGFPSECRHPVWRGKTRMAWLPDGEKIYFEDIFSLFGATHERDRRTVGQTPHAGNSPAYA